MSPPTPSADGPIALSAATGRQLVYFAAERTLLVWISTSLGLMGLGFVVDRFGLALRHMLAAVPPAIASDELSAVFGTSLVLLGGLMSVVAAIRYARFAADYHRTSGAGPGYGIRIGVGFAVVVAFFAIAIAVLLLTVTD